MGYVSSRVLSDYEVNLYANTLCDPSGHGDADLYIGTVSVTTDPNGYAPAVIALQTRTPQPMPDPAAPTRQRWPLPSMKRAGMDIGPAGRRALRVEALLLVPILLVLAVSVQAAGNSGGRGDVYLTGSLSATMSLYSGSGNFDAHKASSWTFRGAPVLHLYGHDMPLSLTVTEQDRTFRQPLNRLGINPRFGWTTGHLGYTSLNWSPFSLAGQSILGVGLEEKPGLFDFGFIAGRIRRTVEAADIAGVGHIAPVYRRTGYAARAGVGDKRRHASLVVVRGGDDENSLAIAPSATTVLPAENLVVSLLGHYAFDPRFVLDCELAQSAYTDDKQGPVDGKFSKGLLKAFGFMMDRRTSSHESQAFSAKFGWKDPRGGVDVAYKRIDPNYRSMGAYYFNSDLENVTVEPKWKFARNKVRVAGSLGFQHDNLADTKDVKTTRTIGSGRVDWMPGGKYAANLTYSNYSLDQKAGRSPLDPNSTKIAQATNNLGITQSLTLTGARLGQNAILAWSRQDMQDHTRAGNLDASYTADQINAQYALTWIPWGLSVNAGFNHSSYETATATTKVHGPLLGANLSFWRHKATLGASGTVSSTSVDGDQTLRTLLLRIQGSLRPTRRHRFTLGFSYHHNDARTPGGTDDIERRGEIGYAYAF